VNADYGSRFGSSWTEFMEFGTLLAPDAVVLEPSATTQRQVFERIARLLSAGTEVSPDAVVAALVERERMGTTGFGGGGAIPHGRVAGLPRLAAAVVRLSQPVDWSSVDGMPVDVVIALAGPETAGADNLKALALLSRTLRDQSLVGKIRGARDAAALWALLAGQAREAA
jgi:nitrogen PTS system EIIA component